MSPASISACASLEEVRANIDRVDRAIVALIAQRGGYVNQAASFKTTTDDVRAPRRVEQVITKVTAFAAEAGANPTVVERAYRSMIAAFVEQELARHGAFLAP